MNDRATIEQRIIGLQEQRAMLGAQIAACRNVLRRHDRLQQAVLVAEALQAGTVPTVALTATQRPAALDTPILDAEVVENPLACKLCPSREPFPTMQGLRLHEQRAHPEMVRERRQQAARDAAADAAFPKGGRR